MKLYIIRHGETEWNKVKRLQGQTDIPLAENGIKLAKETGVGMKDIPIDLVISSPLKRAVKTAELVTAGRNIPMVTDQRIQEICFGVWEGESVLDSRVLPKEFIKKFYEDPLHCVKPPKGETFAEVCERTRDFYLSLLANREYEDKNILISSHGAASRCLLCNFYEDKTDIWRGGVPANCSVSIVEIAGGRTKILGKDKIFYEQ